MRRKPAGRLSRPVRTRGSTGGSSSPTPSKSSSSAIPIPTRQILNLLEQFEVVFLSISISRFLLFLFPFWYHSLQCAASMDVRVGSFCDPDGLEGLAHFLGIFFFLIIMEMSCFWWLNLCCCSCVDDLFGFYSVSAFEFVVLQMSVLVLYSKLGWIMKPGLFWLAEMIACKGEWRIWSTEC